MKKVTFLLAALLIGGMMLTGCKKDDPQPTPEPTPTTAKVTYQVGGVFFGATTSDCFKYTITYVGADGKNVTVKDVTLPWTSPELTVTLPFNAKVEGNYTYEEESLPDQVVFGQIPSITSGEEVIAVGSSIMASVGKDVFVKHITEHPEELNFSLSGEVK